MVSQFRVIKAFRNKEAYSFSSLQCNFPADRAQEVLDWGKKNIPNDDLAPDGRETDIHVTLKYGLHHHDPIEVRHIFNNVRPFDLTLGPISIFESAEHDVVKIGVTSPELVRLNEIVSESFPHTDTHPDYVAHVTIAYVRPGSGKKYVGNKDFVGKKVHIDSIEFSGNDNRKTCLPLGK